MCIADYIQDSVLLVDVAGTLFVNLNDCRARGSARLIRRIASGYRRSYVLRLTGHGDADMIHFFDEEGDRLPYAGSPVPVGTQLSDLARHFGASHVVPFSSFHQYQRADSVWANRHITRVADYRDGFDERVAEYVEPFVAIEAETGAVTPLEPEAIPPRVRPPEDFGDCWSDELEKSDEATVARYFQRKEGLQKRFGFLRLVVGGRTLAVPLAGPPRVGITFEVPRGSLMQAVEYEIFDDLLIGNFMRTTLHHVRSLYDPDFTFTVAKYADNAGVETDAALRAYMAEYRRRAGLELSVALMAGEIAGAVRRYVDADSWWYRAGKSLYYRLHA
jgi:hypothetical protein